jgi:hypothetical protein
MLSLSCEPGRRPAAIDAATSAYDAPKVVGQIKSDAITESSGLAASPCQPGVLWTHNDSGDGPYIFAINASGANLGVWRVANAENVDWEDIAAFRDAAGKCFLYIGEIGNTDKLERSVHKIYRVVEPNISAGSSGLKKGDAPLTEAASVIVFKYSDTAHDAETLIVHPASGDIYVLTKNRNTPSGVFKIGALRANGPAVARKLANIAVPAIPNGVLTGGSISPDGTRVILSDYGAGYELILPAGAAFDEIWRQSPIAVNLGERRQGEAVTYSADGVAILATSEKKNSPVIEVRRR